jgi:hypothetical protein
MSEQVKRIPINYTDSNIEIKLINGGNINMEEDDFVFEGSVAHTYTKSTIGIQKAIDELKKNINNLDYLNKE